MNSLLLEKNLKDLLRLLPRLGTLRGKGPFANDAFEAIADTLSLARRALANDERVNYLDRAREEKALLLKLSGRLRDRVSEDNAVYSDAFRIAIRTLEQIETIPTDPCGYLGVLTTLGREFTFLASRYEFRVVEESTLGRRYSSGEVYVDLQYSEEPILTCSFGDAGREGDTFWLDDLLLLYGDDRYETLFQDVSLKTSAQVDEWFTFVASVWKEYGDEVLRNEKNVFERLQAVHAGRRAAEL